MSVAEKTTASPLEEFEDRMWERLPEMPLGDWFENFVSWAQTSLRGFFRFIADMVHYLVDSLGEVLTFLPSIVMVLVLAGLGMWARGWRFGLIALIGLTVAAWTPYWDQTMTTLALVAVASTFALLLAVPIGILSAENRTVATVVRPILDFMQTLPAFVYLIPAVAFFSTGTTPGVIATLVFCMPPGVRLTTLGLQQVDKEVVEAGEAFGVSPAWILTRIKLPLALPTIMAGVNQVIMLALSMVVISGLVGAPGLGQVIVQAFSRVDVSTGFTAGLCVVILAIYLDRVTGALSYRTKVAKAERAMSSS